MAVAFVGLLISHGYSFVSNFLLGGEREQASTRDLMSAPYKRIVILHVAIIAGGFAVAALGQPLVLLIVLIALKLVLDIALHRQERRRSTAL
jgi:ABC-type multidrug transport system permease subunit